MTDKQYSDAELRKIHAAFTMINESVNGHPFAPTLVALLRTIALGISLEDRPKAERKVLLETVVEEMREYFDTCMAARDASLNS